MSTTNNDPQNISSTGSDIQRDLSSKGDPAQGIGRNSQRTSETPASADTQTQITSKSKSGGNNNQNKEEEIDESESDGNLGMPEGK
ncbi:MAG: hypothetical protein JWN76_3541 [Chitinophagaceae bacterium]|nr:hypothetical protein [Chitinophagaceae bacterium]